MNQHYNAFLFWCEDAENETKRAIEYRDRGSMTACMLAFEFSAMKYRKAIGELAKMIESPELIIAALNAREKLREATAKGVGND